MVCQLRYTKTCLASRRVDLTVLPGAECNVLLLGGHKTANLPQHPTSQKHQGTRRSLFTS